jgi:hypothetical protein
MRDCSATKKRAYYAALKHGHEGGPRSHTSCGNMLGFIDDRTGVRRRSLKLVLEDRPKIVIQGHVCLQSEQGIPI